MKHASHYTKKEGIVHCQLCSHKCRIPKGKTGICGVRFHDEDGKLYSLVHSKPIAVHVDPIEKKPLFHFLPGEKALSIGTVGCNFKCKQCQNWYISQTKDIKGKHFEPEEVVRLAVKSGCKIIAYTYNEPTIFFEYMKDIAMLAKKKGIRNIMVSNGYMTKKALEDACEFINAVNVDLKGFTEEFYKKTCSAKLKPVLDTLKHLKKKNIWLEITNLIIPSLNDDPG